MYLGYCFFVPGKYYTIITHRPDTAHFPHYFPVGTKVKCIDVTLKGNNTTVLGSMDFKHKSLSGLFEDSDGIQQDLATGDVKLWRLY